MNTKNGSSGWSKGGKANKGKPKSEDHKRKISLANIGKNSKKYILIDPNDNYHDVFGLKSFCIEHNLSDFENKTVELVGPKINGNKHGLVKNALIIHGAIDVSNSIGDKWKTHETMIEWLKNDGKQFEGVVIHFSDGSCYKTHRGHVNMNTLDWGCSLI